MLVSRPLLAAIAIIAVCSLWASNAQARWLNPWGLGVTVGGGYTFDPPHANLDPGAYLTTGLELRYTSHLGVGGGIEIQFGGAFHEQNPNPFDSKTSLIAMPVMGTIFYEHPARNLRPYIALGMGYTYWKLDRSKYHDNDTVHRMNMTLRGGLSYRVYEQLFITGMIETMWPNLLSGSEQLTTWVGFRIGTIWRF